MATIKDIAHRAVVSVATVSYVLNNTRYVSPDKKERVLQAIQDLNYVPNAVARGLRVRESRTIALMMSDITNPFYPDLAMACEEVARSRGYSLMMINTNDRPGALKKAAVQVREGKVDGLIVTTAMENDRDDLLNLTDGGYPVVLAHRELSDMPIDTIVSANEQGGYLAASHLIRLGHKRIAFITGVEGSSVNSLRQAGYFRAMREADMAVDERWLPSGEAKYQQSYDAAVSLLSLPAAIRPTAVINLSDLGAMATLDAAADHGMKVPEDLAVMGFDDLLFSASRGVQLTTVRIPRYELGEKAAQRLLDRIGTKEPLEPMKTVLPVEIVVRRTCGGS